MVFDRISSSVVFLLLQLDLNVDVRLVVSMRCLPFKNGELVWCGPHSKTQKTLYHESKSDWWLVDVIQVSFVWCLVHLRIPTRWPVTSESRQQHRRDKLSTPHMFLEKNVLFCFSPLSFCDDVTAFRPLLESEWPSISSLGRIKFYCSMALRSK